MVDYIQQMDFSIFVIFCIKIIIGIITLIWLLSHIRIIREYDRAVVYRLGRVLLEKGPGLVFLIPFIDSIDTVDIRIQSMELDVQDVITQDTVSIKIHPVIYYQVVDAVKSEIAIDGWGDAIERLGAKTLRSIGGQNTLDNFLSGGNKIPDQIQAEVDRVTETWGIKITLVEFIGIDLPESMTRAMAAAAEAQRQRLAVVISAEGELEAAQKLSDAAKIMSENPASLQLRYLKTIAEVGADNATILAFPLPMEFFPTFSKMKDIPAEADKTITID